jgi:L-ascorbate metabolism protein UlaG (beta-lactamase superfamily)
MADDGMRAMSLGPSDHFDGRRFVNPDGTAGQPFSKVPRMLLARRTPWPEKIDEPVRTPPALDDAGAIATFVGHATFLIQTAAGNILTDPMYSQRAGPLNVMGPRRVRQPAVRFDDLPPIALVLLSHNHYDHCDVPTLRALARRFDPIVVTPLGNGAIVRACGVRRVEELDWWQASASAPVPVTLTPAYHFSARGPFDKNRALWGGFVIRVPSGRIYFAGDTAYGPFFRDVPERCGAVDLALLPIGAYEPRWFMRVVHMNPEEAVQAHVDLQSRQSVAMHYGTFQLTAEGIDDPVKTLEEACRTRHVPPDQFHTLGFGESVRL